jgi:spermidine synthase
LAERKRVGLNYDFRPVSYYYNLIFWAAHFRDNLFKGLLEAVNSGRIWLIVIVFGILVAVMGFLRKQKREVVLAAVLVMGFTQMSLQIVILLTFQIIYGYIFYKLGLLISCFMIGLALGSFWMTKAMPEIKKDRAVFLRLQGAICLYPLCLAGIFSWLLSLNTATGSWIGANLIFPILPVAAGCISGAQFPLANKIYIGKREEVGRVAGLTYGLDLLGSCFGSTLAALFFIPLLGIPQTCLAIALLNLFVLIALILS